MSEPQDVAEGLDEEMLGSDPVMRDEFGATEMPGDVPFAVDEEMVTEPIIDSVASRDDRLMPEVEAMTPELLGEARDPADELIDELVADEVRLVADNGALSAEEAAIHTTDEPE